MPSIDLPIKRLVQRRSGDWVRFLQRSCREEWIRPFKSEYTPKAQSKLDEVFAVEDPEGTYLVNFEPMGYYDPALPARMMRYHQLSDYWGNLKTLEFTYLVVRVWEEPRQSVIERGLIGLYPLLPLMKGEKGEEARQVLQQSITVVSEIEDEALRQDLLAVMGILAGGKYAAELVYSMIRREMVMQSPIYQEWVREERAEAETKGRMEAKKETILKYLSRRFGEQPADLEEKVQKISDLQILDRILDELFTVGTIEEARAVILGKIAGGLQ
ncbi:hypothetical protein MOTE_25210 [Moorella thermoacetica]|uniref:DUF4351 domain-containing protein n=1 Tax=Neomoorella thermoacetica TaxID=1525 RepID=A0A1J5N3D8_NEOTH|nr:hypothetical protein MOTE_25210 [Moorella thermoacetica]